MTRTCLSDMTSSCAGRRTRLRSMRDHVLRPPADMQSHQTLRARRGCVHANLVASPTLSSDVPSLQSSSSWFAPRPSLLRSVRLELPEIRPQVGGLLLVLDSREKHLGAGN